LFFNETSQKSNGQLQKQQNTQKHKTKKRKQDCLLTHSMKQWPSWEANRSTPNREIPRILWNTNVQYRMYKCPYPEPHQCSLGNRKEGKYKQHKTQTEAYLIRALYNNDLIIL
jgi:hypothetical protein